MIGKVTINICNSDYYDLLIFNTRLQKLEKLKLKSHYVSLKSS